MNPDDEQAGPECGWWCQGCRACEVPECLRCGAADPENCDHRGPDDFDDDGGHDDWPGVVEAPF